jgi:hypothetical protein
MLFERPALPCIVATAGYLSPLYVRVAKVLQNGLSLRPILPKVGKNHRSPQTGILLPKTHRPLK